MKLLTWAAATASSLLTLCAAVPAGAQPIIIGPAPYYDDFYGPVIEPAQYYFWGGRRYCWYFEGWRGPGWYWCGYGARYGYGWGGGWGWHGWRHGGYRDRYAYGYGGYRHGYGGYGGHWHGGGHEGGGHHH